MGGCVSNVPHNLKIDNISRDCEVNIFIPIKRRSNWILYKKKSNKTIRMYVFL